jgi:hypothetical protein
MSNDMQHDPLNNGKKRRPISLAARIILPIVGVVIIFACLYIGLLIVGGITLGTGMASGGDTILHSDPNSDHSIIVHAVSDDCGATCDCSTRLDITYGQETKKNIYRVRDSCDVTIQWIDQYRFEVVDQPGESVILDARDFQNNP